MRRSAFACLAILMIALLSACGLPGSGSSGGSSMTPLRVGDHSSCHAGTGQPTTCTIVLSNDAASTGDFHWSATSSVPGVVFSPSSGTVSPGASSDPVQATIPEGECPFTLTFAEANIVSLGVHVSSC